MLLFFEGMLLYHYAWRQQNLLHVDLPSLYFAAQMAFRHHVSPYDFPLMATQAPVIQQPIFPFLYPPPSLVPLAPFALVSYPTAKWGMVALNHLLTPLLAYLLAFRLSRVRNLVLSLFVGAFLLISFPVTQTIAHDQLNLVVAVAICTCWLGLRNDRAWWPGVPLAVAILLKQSPLLLLVALVFERRWRALATTCAILVLAAGASVVLIPSDAWRDWLVVVRPTLGYGTVPANLFSPACPYNQGINGLVSRLFLPAVCMPTDAEVPIVGRAATYSLALGVIGLSILAIWLAKRLRFRNRLSFEFALLLLAMYLVSPLSWEHHLVLVLPSLVVATDIVLRRQAHLWLSTCLLAICVLGVALPLPIDHPGLSTGAAVHVISLRTYAVMLLWVLLLFDLYLRVKQCLLDKEGALPDAVGVPAGPRHGPPRPGEQRRSSIDPARGRRELELGPPLELGEGVARTARWFADARVAGSVGAGERS